MVGQSTQHGAIIAIRLKVLGVHISRCTVGRASVQAPLVATWRTPFGEHERVPYPAGDTWEIRGTVPDAEDAALEEYTRKRAGHFSPRIKKTKVIQRPPNTLLRRRLYEARMKLRVDYHSIADNYLVRLPCRSAD